MKLRVLLDRFHLPAPKKNVPWTGVERRRLPASKFRQSGVDTVLVDARLSDLRQQRAVIDEAINCLEIERQILLGEEPEQLDRRKA